VLTRVAQVFSLLTFGKTLAQSALHGVRHHETPRDGRRLRAGAGFSSFVRVREPHRPGLRNRSAWQVNPLERTLGLAW